jgi:hypothetical protein
VCNQCLQWQLRHASALPHSSRVISCRILIYSIHLPCGQYAFEPEFRPVMLLGRERWPRIAVDLGYAFAKEGAGTHQKGFGA